MEETTSMQETQLRANDGRIPLGKDKPASKHKTIPRGSKAAQDKIDELDREGRIERNAYRRKCYEERKTPGLSSEDKKHMRGIEKSTLIKMKKDNMYKQAECYAKESGMTLSNDLTYKDLETISIRCFLPQYTRGEELASAITHIVGGAFGVVMVILGIYYTMVTNNTSFGVGGTMPFNRTICGISMGIFGFGAIFLYTISAIYHFLWVNPGKKVLRIIDHCTIYFLIASTYTPMALMALPNAYGMGMTWVYVVLAIEWGLGITLTVFNCLWLNNKFVSGLSMAGYIILGWMIIAFTPELITEIGLAGFLWILFGGVAYTAGAIFHGLGVKIRYCHAIAHGMYVIGTVCHFIGILVYLVIGA